MLPDRVLNPGPLTYESGALPIAPRGPLSLPRKSVVRLTDRPDMTSDAYRGRKTTIQQQQLSYNELNTSSLLRIGVWYVKTGKRIGNDAKINPIIVPGHIKRSS